MSASIESWAQNRSAPVTFGQCLVPSPPFENHAAEAEALLKSLFPHTGAAYLSRHHRRSRTGKSTLVDRLATHYRKAQQKAALLQSIRQARTRGAILGGSHPHAKSRRRRRHFHYVHARAAFSAAFRVATAKLSRLDAAGKKNILIETVASGRTKLTSFASPIALSLSGSRPRRRHPIHESRPHGNCGYLLSSTKPIAKGADRLEEPASCHALSRDARDGWHPPVIRTVATETPALILSRRYRKIPRAFRIERPA